MLIILKDVFRFVNNQMRGQAIFQVEVCDTCSSVSETVLSYKIYIKSNNFIFNFFFPGKRKERKEKFGTTTLN